MRNVLRFALTLTLTLLLPLASHASGWSAAGVTGTIFPSNDRSFINGSGGISSYNVLTWNGAGITFSSSSGTTGSFPIVYNVVSNDNNPA
jgi:hypothetical protein